VQIVRGADLVVDLPDITASIEPEAGATDDRERQWEPDFTLAVDPPAINYDIAQKDGSITVDVHLRPLANFAGEVTLFVEGLPPGVTADFGRNPVNLTQPESVPLVLRGGKDISENAVLTVRAAGGGLEREVQVAALLATGKLVIKPRRIVVNRGDRTGVRVDWQLGGAAGQAARISFGQAPKGLSVKLDTMRAHEYAQPLQLQTLTVQEAEDRHNGLRTIVAIPDDPAPRPMPITLTPDKIRRAPLEAPQKGILLAPGGWAELSVIADAKAKPGNYKIPVTIQIDNLKMTDSVPVQIK
jgi:hypothetical protein